MSKFPETMVAMKKINTQYAQELIMLSMLLWGLSSCESDNLFSVQNCNGGSAEIIIELGMEQSKIEPEIAGLIREGKINFKLEYSEEKTIFSTTFKEIKEGLPFKKMIIIRDTDTTTFNHGDNILPFMDTDVIGEVACPYTICI